MKVYGQIVYESGNYGNTTYAGTYRMAYLPDGSKFLEIRKTGKWVRIAKPIPAYVRGAYAAANWLGV